MDAVVFRETSPRCPVIIIVSGPVRAGESSVIVQEMLLWHWRISLIHLEITFNRHNYKFFHAYHVHQWMFIVFSGEYKIFKNGNTIYCITELWNVWKLLKDLNSIGHIWVQLDHHFLSIDFCRKLSSSYCIATCFDLNKCENIQHLTAPLSERLAVVRGLRKTLSICISWWYNNMTWLIDYKWTIHKTKIFLLLKYRIFNQYV